MKRKVWGLAVLLCLLLSACSGNQAQNEPMNTPSNTPSQDSVSMPPEEPAFSLAPSTNEPETKETHLPEPVARIHNGITVKIDPAIELLSIVQYLSGYDDALGLLTDLEFQYKDEIDAYFSGYSGHAAVAFVNDNMEKGFAFNVPPGILFYMGEDFSFDKQGYEESYLAKQADIDVEYYIEALRSFYDATDFKTFFESHLNYYNTLIDNTIKAMPKWNMIEVMEAFYGRKMGSYNLVLVSLFHSGGYGANTPGTENPNIYSILGSLEASGETVSFGSTDIFSRLVLHEFGHSFIRISEAEKEYPQITQALKESASLMEPIEEQMKSSAYPTWDYACEELVLRAAVIRQLFDNQGFNTLSLLEYERKEGFIYIYTVYNGLDEYIENRSNYPDFNDFIPTLLQDLAETHQ